MVVRTGSLPKYLQTTELNFISRSVKTEMGNDYVNDKTKLVLD